MKRRSAFALALVMAVSGSIAVTRAAAAQPTINGPAGIYYTSAALWYLGPSGSSANYNQSVTLTATAPPGDGNPDPSISWSVNIPSLLAVYPSGSPPRSALIITKGPSYTTAQSGSPNYNIQVTVTWDGMVSAPYLVFNNVPYSNTVVNAGKFCNANGCDCNANNPGQGYQGYDTLNQVYVRDLFGNTLAPIVLHETLENPQLKNGWTTPPIGTLSPSYWLTSYWTGSWFPDEFSECKLPTQQPNPPLESSGTGGTLGLTVTQKYWIGTTTLGFGRGFVRREMSQISIQTTALRRTLRFLGSLQRYATWVI